MLHSARSASLTSLPSKVLRVRQDPRQPDRLGVDQEHLLPQRLLIPVALKELSGRPLGKTET